MPITVQPVKEPVTLDEIKEHLRIETNDEDVLLSSYISAARGFIEKATGRALITQTWVQTFPAFPCSQREQIELMNAPLQSVTSIVYFDMYGAQQTLDSASYIVDTYGVAGRVALKPAYVWPYTYIIPSAVVVTYACGYGAEPESVPAELRQAILLLVGHWYENREAVLTGTIASALAFTVDALTANFKVHPNY